MAGKNGAVDPIEEEANREEGLRGTPEEVSKVEIQEPSEADPDEALDREEARENARDRKLARGANYRTMRERSAANEALAEERRAALEAKDRELAELRAQALQRPQDQRQQTGVVDTIRAELQKTYDAQSRLQAEYQQRAGQYARANREMPEAEYRKYHDQAAELDERRLNQLSDIRDAQREPQRRQEQQHAQFVARAPDVFGNERAALWARAEWTRRTAENPDQDYDKLFDDVVEGARRAILGKRPAPNQAARQRSSGMSRGAGTVSGAQSRTFHVTPGIKKMAMARYPKLDEKEAVQKWVNVHGKSVQEDDQAQGR